MNYIREKTPPVREDRLNACNAFGGSCCELSKTGKKGCLNKTKRSFAQTQGCQLNLSMAILNTIRDSVVIIHGPIGCGGAGLSFGALTTQYHKLRDSNAKGYIWVNTNLDESDVINGGEKKLSDAILFADSEFRPSSIIIVNSCVPALIGDDIDSVVAGLQNQVAAKLVPVHCEGFKTKIMASAYDSAYHGILRNLVREPQQDAYEIEDKLELLKAEYRKSRMVNVLNVSSMSRADELELERLLKALDLKVRFLPCFAHPDDFELVAEAALNVSICATHDDYFVKHLKEKYNIPYILHTIPIGIRNTNKWLLEIAEFFGETERAKGLIAVESRELNEALEPFRSQLKGKRVFLSGGEIRILTTAELFQDIGFEVIGVRGYHYDEFADPLIEALPDNEKILFNVATGQPFEQANLLEEFKPDLYVGHSGINGWATKQGIPVFPIFVQSINYMGYSGMYELTRRVTKVLKNTQFSKNFKNNFRLPYKSQWYEKNPFAYIDSSLAL
ncbi:MAG: nitrogenase molybdenum-iron protein alpha and beta chain [Eubacterium sp.]|nr:nitrogenase molybdenum-iron protein alpha and beta chain [Eubacterium sp.]